MKQTRLFKVLWEETEQVTYSFEAEIEVEVESDMLDVNQQDFVKDSITKIVTGREIDVDSYATNYSGEFDVKIESIKDVTEEKLKRSIELTKVSNRIAVLQKEMKEALAIYDSLA